MKKNLTLKQRMDAYAKWGQKNTALRDTFLNDPWYSKDVVEAMQGDGVLSKKTNWNCINVDILLKAFRLERR